MCAQCGLRFSLKRVESDKRPPVVAKLSVGVCGSIRLGQISASLNFVSLFVAGHGDKVLCAGELITVGLVATTLELVGQLGQRTDRLIVLLIAKETGSNGQNLVVLKIFCRLVIV
jgi:hypothetical protein